VKFRVGITKSVEALTITSSPAAVGSDVYLIPYSTQKSKTCTSGKVNEDTKVESKYSYYTLSYPLDDKMVSCPIANASGEIIALAQKSADKKGVSYGLDASFATSLSISILAMNDANLKAIAIKKDLPNEENQALVYLYMSSSLVPNEAYTELLNDFIAKFPNSADGYVKRAENSLANDKNGSQIEAVQSDLDRAIKLSQHRDDALYNAARLMYASLTSSQDKIDNKKWSLDTALADIREAISISELPLYVQLEGNILFAQKKYDEALVSYQKVNKSNIASAASLYSTAMTMQMLKRDNKEIVAMMDSCVNICVKPFTRDAAPYILARAQAYTEAGMYRPALLDYNTYYDVVNGNVNDLFYYYREQAANKAKQYQQALDDIQKAIDMNPKEMLYRVEQGAMNLRVGRVDIAAKQLEEALKIDDKYAETYRILGLCKIEQKKKDEACTLFNKSKELGDENAQAAIDKYCK
jgi:tetratricopeptide (TPR) repeat protein